MNDFKSTLTQRLPALLLLLVLAAVSFFGLAGPLSSPEFHQKSLAALDEKKMTVVELTATAAASSVAIAAIPTDATDPIADQVAKLSSYLLVISGIIMLEKFLLTLTGYVAFRYLIPLSCILAILFLFTRFDLLRRLAMKLCIFGLAICLVIPVSLKASSLFDAAFQNQQDTRDVISELEESVPEDSKDTSTGGFFSKVGSTISGAVSRAAEKAQKALSQLIDAVAVLLISNCVIPVLVLFVFLWLLRTIFGLQISTEKLKSVTLPQMNPKKIISGGKEE